jgi:hypothetical protein
MNPTDGATLSSIDFNGPEALRATSANLTLGGYMSGQLATVSSAFATAGGSSVLFMGTQTANPVVPFTGLTGSAVATGDLHALSIRYQDGPVAAHAVESYFANVGDRTISVGPPQAAVTVTALSGTPNIRLHMEIPSQEAYGTSMVAEYSTGGFGALYRGVEIAVTSAYLGKVPTKWSLDMPDLTTAPGFNAQHGIATIIGLSFVGITTGGSQLFFALPTAGQTMIFATREGYDLGTISGSHTAAALTTPHESEAHDAWSHSNRLIGFKR